MDLYLKLFKKKNSKYNTQNPKKKPKTLTPWRKHRQKFTTFVSDFLDMTPEKDKDDKQKVGKSHVMKNG